MRKIVKIAYSRLFRINGLGVNCSHVVDSISIYTYPLVPVGLSGHLECGIPPSRVLNRELSKSRCCSRPRRELARDTNPLAPRNGCKGREGGAQEKSGMAENESNHERWAMALPSPARRHPGFRRCGA